MIDLKVRLFIKALMNGTLGIGVEILMTAVFILAGFGVCVLWWGLFK